MITHRLLQRGFGGVLLACVSLVMSPAVAGVAFQAVVDSHVRDASNNDVTGGSLTPGTVVHDEATVTRSAGTPADLPNPSGNVSFTLYDNGTCNGAVVATDPNKPLIGAGTATTASFTTPAAGGAFSYRAHYNGDTNYDAGDGPCEAFTVVINVATVVTHVRDQVNNDVTGVSLTAGTVVHDEATVTKSAGTPAGVPDPTGTVGFTLYDNSTCNGSVVATDPGRPLVGGTAASANFTTPAAGGTFSYIAHYSGDANYTPVDGACEAFTVVANVANVVTHVRDAANNDITGGAVQAGTVIHDEATVARAVGTPSGVPDPTGTVDFTLYDNGTCNGLVVATDPGKPLVSGAAASANFTTPAAGGTFSYRAHYNGDVDYAPADGACEAFTDQVGRVTPTNVECTDVLAGTAPALGQINYGVFAGRVSISVTPGVFFFWTKITTTVPNQVVTVSESNTSTNNAALFTVLQAWDRLYTGNCATWKSGTLIVGGAGASFTVPTPGTYFIGLKYQTKSLAGTAPPIPADIIYNFTTSLGLGTGGSVPLKKTH